ncbi:hypothetical protein BDN72DRAFT_530250 [Pluteus cervinus]|uniref:Uncharacterized protein n=1 Tax=Pluteus cervinus TaxID=181527 RepID=A0ACD3AY27_9AGAR|nr:hypothetical protein BDN72DRAFT_530250 [Pluteus cervinus]
MRLIIWATLRRVLGGRSFLFSPCRVSLPPVRAAPCQTWSQTNKIFLLYRIHPFGSLQQSPFMISITAISVPIRSPGFLLSGTSLPLSLPLHCGSLSDTLRFTRAERLERGQPSPVHSAPHVGELPHVGERSLGRPSYRS